MTLPRHLDGARRHRRPIDRRAVLIPLALLGCSGTDGTLVEAGASGAREVADASDAPKRELPYLVGADVSSVPEQVDLGTSFVDVDGRGAGFLPLLRAHGFNAVRLRTFVSPAAEYGYASASGGCQRKGEAYNDLWHLVDAARAVKAEGMHLLVNLHYSDTWADPSKQVVPESFRDATTIDELARRVRDYTLEVMTSLADAGATPDVVQVGNEITPGFLIHEPTAESDCFGNRARERSGVTGSARNVERFARLLMAGISAVREVDDSIHVMLHVDHLDRPEGVVDWAQRLLDAGVTFDVLGLSAYPQYQGPASEWPGAVQLIAERLPTLSLSVAEYNHDARSINDLLRAIPNQRGLGSFFWEPTLTGPWGRGLFDARANSMVANGEAFAAFDSMRSDYAP